MTTVATAARTGLARHTVGWLSLLFFTVSASAPMTVVAGGVPATYAVTGVVGVPLSFLTLGLALWLCSAGYGAMARFVANAGPFYAYLAQGISRAAGVAGGVLALVAYNAIQISLYGLLGATIAVHGGPWWLWAAIAWAVVGVIGILRVSINAKVLAVVLTAEVLMIVVFDVAAFLHPAGGSISTTSLSPGSLFTPGVGGVFALGVAAFIGFESGGAFTEETRNRSVVRRATVTAVLGIAVLYAASSWAMAVTVGADHIIEVARDPAAGLPMGTLAGLLGPAAGQLATVLLITSMGAAMISFHATVARYVFSMSRDGVLPQRWSRIGSGGSGGAPVIGSLLQTIVAGITIAVFAVLGLDPVQVMFTWLSSVAALSVMTLMVAVSIAVIRFFHQRPNLHVSVWDSVFAPLLGGVLLFAALITTMINVSSLLGGVPVPSWLMPAVVAAPVVGGLMWAWWLRAARPDVHRRIGVGWDQQLSTLDHSLGKYLV